MTNDSSAGRRASDAARSTAESARRQGERAKEQGEDAGAAVQQSKAYQGLVTFGLVCYGLIHLLLGFICVRVATGGGGDASNQGALKEIASKPFGTVLLAAVGVGLAALVVWQLLEALMGNQQFTGKQRVVKRFSSAARAITYGALAVSTFRFVAGGSGGDSNAGAQSATGQLMAAPGGQLLVGIVGAVIIAVGISQVVKGIRRKFIEEDLDSHIAGWAQKLGTVGWAAKGMSLVLVGALFGWAAISFDPNKSGGLDDGLKTLSSMPFGVVLLIAMAVGFACFAVFCFVWSRHARHDKASA